MDNTMNITMNNILIEDFIKLSYVIADLLKTNNIEIAKEATDLFIDMSQKLRMQIV